MWIKIFLNVNIINLKKVDKPRREGVGQWGKIFFVEFGHFSMLFGSFMTYLVVFIPYLSITMREKNLKRLNKRSRKTLFIWIKVDKGKGGGGSGMWIKKILSVNIINFGQCG